MPSLAWSKGRKRMIEEQAKEELEVLQLLHPDHFEYLKLELKSFIQLLQSQSQPFSHQPNADETSGRSPSFVDPASQESSSCKKWRKVEDGGKKTHGGELQREITVSELREENGKSRRNRVDVVLERAEVCLQKIRRFKTALFSGARC